MVIDIKFINMHKYTYAYIYLLLKKSNIKHELGVLSQNRNTKSEDK